MKLPIFLCPKFKCELIRLGKKNDGGYAISKESLKDSKVIFGFGLGDDWSFEKDFYQLNPVSIHAYDHTITKGFFYNLFEIWAFSSCNNNP